MAYSTTTDYTALQNELRKQKASATDAATQAAIQAQIDEAQQSRNEKIASDINTYGKYASASELDSAAGIMATNQIGTGYETQKANLNKAYDNARINANNDALSRGMARSSFVSDRLANLDTERANALSDVDASKALAIQNAKANILSNYQTSVANAATQTYNQNLDRANTLAQYGDVSGYKDVGYTDAQIAAMNKYLQDQAAAKAAKTYSGGGSYSGSGGGVVDDTPKLVEFNSGQQSALYAGKLADAAASYQVGMNRTAQGQLATIQRLYNAGQITEAQAQALIKKFNLG